MKIVVSFLFCAAAFMPQVVMADIVKMTPLETFVSGTNETLRAAKAYTDAHSGGGGGVDTNAVREIAREEIGPATNEVMIATDAKLSPIEEQVASLSSSVSGLQSSKLDARTIHWDSDGDLVIGGDSVYPNLRMFTGSIEEVGAISLERPDGIAYLSPIDSRLVWVDISKIAEIDSKRDLTDNTCHKTEFTEWVCNPAGDGGGNTYSISYNQSKGIYYLDLLPAYPAIASILSERDDKVVLDFYSGVTATRTAVCTDGKKFVTEDVVDGKVSDAVSTNNPAFVSAVRNTPTENMPDDMPTDWGTYGTVGAALAALAAFVKWAKAKIVAVIGDDGEPTDTFAADLLGKQVAISAIDERIKTNAESAAEPTNAVTLNDNAPKTVTVATVESPATPSLAVTFGTARNGGLRICELYILNGTADTDLTFDSAVHFVSTGDSFPACEAGINYFVFAEVAANLWKVTRETLKSITTPTPVAAA